MQDHPAARAHCAKLPGPLRLVRRHAKDDTLNPLLTSLHEAAADTALHEAAADTALHEAAADTALHEAAAATVFLLPWLCGAGVVVVSRFLHAADLGYDLTAQLQAAQHLLAGKGLTVYSPVTQDLADPLALVTLTHFPAGYSLCAAMLLALGADTGLALKILGATATLLGWWGWGRLAFAYMVEGWRQAESWRWAARAIAIFTPLLFTPAWSGTDIFLWAAMPWVLAQIVRPLDQHSIRLDVTAGMLTGFCVLMRYASLFLAGFAFLVIACQCRFRPASLLRRCGSYAAGLFPFLATQIYIISTLSSGSSSPGGLVFDPGSAIAMERAQNGLIHVTTVNAAAFFWVPQRRLELLMGDGTLRWLGVGLALAMFLLPLVVILAKRGRLTWSLWHDVHFVAPCLFVFLPLFLLLCETEWLGYVYARDPRYYSPLVPLAVLVACFIVQTKLHVSGQRATLLRFTSGAYLILFLSVLVAQTAFLIVPGERGQFRRQMFIGVSPLYPWPSKRLTYEFSPARTYVLATLTTRPNAILITNRPNWFYADDKVDRSRIQRIERCDPFLFSRLTGPAKMLLFVADRGGPLQELYWFEGSREPTRAHCYERLPPFQLVQRFPEEGLKLLEVEIPDGMRVALQDTNSDGGRQLRR